MNKWYVLKTKPHREDQVNILLTKASFATLNPKIKLLSPKKKNSFTIKSLFPSYLFLNIDFNDPLNIHLIKYTRGVSKILCAENKPVALDDEIIFTIKSRMSENGVIEQIPSHLNQGDTVKVTHGLLKDLVGVIEKPVSDEERVIVLLSLVNYKLKASLHWSELEKLQAA
jgi:transcription antitermination factor NusG